MVLVKAKYLKYLKTFSFHSSLCYFCLRRNFPDQKQDNQKAISDCFICQGIFYKINEIVRKIFYIVDFQEKYYYHSFSIGTSLPFFMFDKEDYIRSLYKLKDIENIKSSFNFEIRRNFKSLSKKKLNLINPDIKIDLFISNNKDYSIKTMSRSFYLIGKYKKTKLLTQKEKKDKENPSKDSSNFIIQKKQSIETIIQKTLSNCIKSDRMIFTWSGSEDDNSQVLGKGRLFYIHIINPRERKVNLNKIYSHNGLSFKIIGKTDFLERINLNFRVKNKIFVKTDNPISNFYLRNLQELNNSIIRYYYKSKFIYKKIYNIKFKKLDPFYLIIILECDSGLFLRQFIEGRTLMEPNLSLKLNNQCECLKFDILDVSIS
ncbi:MAG: putative pseudouridylate synthase-like protein [Nitrososphaeraceae archaeon]|nr:putative pseudouridylate synthase-like protein [Nitrososphaeraceae archaeon]